MGLYNDTLEKFRDNDRYEDFALYKVVYKNEVRLCQCGDPATWFAEVYFDDDPTREIWWCDDCI
jgi:hypothetical protein